MLYLIFQGNKKTHIELFKKEKGTKFHSNIRKKNGFKNWLAGTINISGGIYLDEGAQEAINNGASLLPSGIKKVLENFVKVIL